MAALAYADGTAAGINGGGVVRYGQCQRNHAVGIGGHGVDGCQEFTASGPDGTEEALLCVACGCHRSFHRRVVEIAEDDCPAPQTPPPAGERR